MVSDNNQNPNYQEAEAAYIQGNYQQAAEIINDFVLADPDNAKARLLRGHVYRRLQDYGVARSEYEFVLEMPCDAEVRDYAQNSLEEMGYDENYSFHNSSQGDIESYTPEILSSEANTHEYEGDRDYNLFPSEDEPAANNGYNLFPSEDEPAVNNGYNLFPSEDEPAVNNGYDIIDLENSPPEPFLEVNNADYSGMPTVSSDEESYLDPTPEDNYLNPFASEPSGLPPEKHIYATDQFSEEITYKIVEPMESYDDRAYDTEPPSWSESDDFAQEEGDFGLNYQPTMLLGSEKANPSDIEIQEASNYSLDAENYPIELDNSYRPEFGELEESEEPAVAPQEQSPINLGGDDSDRPNAFLEGFGNISTSPSPMDDREVMESSNADWQDFSGNLVIQNTQTEASDSYMAAAPSITSSESFTVTSSSGRRSGTNISRISRIESSSLEPRVTVKQGFLRPIENAPLKRKFTITAIAAGIASAVTVGLISTALTAGNPPAAQGRLQTWQQNALLSLGAGIAGFGSTFAIIGIVGRSIRRSTDDLEAKLQDGIQGNFNTTAMVYSEDEFGRLATRFNQMAGVMLAITSEAQRKAQEEEQKKEDLQRQVIRLLDDVEGAARGDLTVQAEVTADVLGAVADSFNLTIENLREIVQQVKSAAKQVNQESTTSEAFARNLSGDALRQAEELAVTLNSVQVITDSIKRVADNAKEAENVARSASLTALKGGDAVEKTVEGILGIRETVAESTRKVKRLAESSQEISKIVGVISQIASRTNMLALNASIEAARAGEAGRGFAIVADEVRQLADRSAKALKEIEQIVRQIQSDTGSVMTAMEEGTQQVIEGTKLAEKAKRSLEDIITVSNRIDSLVQSITADTVEQTETSQTVAQVMQSVEMTAQSTSQEAQRVSGTLQNLVSVAQDLLNSVERFRVENNY
jgi:twitching motility protein PilJ